MSSAATTPAVRMVDLRVRDAGREGNVGPPARSYRRMPRDSAEEALVLGDLGGQDLYPGAPEGGFEPGSERQVPAGWI